MDSLNKSTYNASSIRILKGSDINFIYTEVERLSAQYNKPKDWVKRCLETYSLAGKTSLDFELDYCQKGWGQRSKPDAEINEIHTHQSRHH